jgi:UDP:flavonoid glycosyltransferase YjiC (YdhE family)
MSRFLIVATGGAGGDLPPLIAAAQALRERGHETFFIGDSAVDRALSGLGLEVKVLPSQLDLGPRLSGAVRDAMTTTGGDLKAAGLIVEQALGAWAKEVAHPVAHAVAQVGSDAVITSLFGVEVLKEAALTVPWAVVNSTFYVGPHPPRPIDEDIGPRAIPLIRRYAQLLEAADMVLHATDPVFDFSFDRLPARHHYVGPLGLWEPRLQAPRYLEEPGDPWVLVSISSQLQDDLPLATAALTALADKPVRVVLTVGPDHRPEEVSVRPANAHIEQVVPHSAVLKRGILLVSHAGHGSVMKALWEGRPMVLVPWGRDQPGVATRARALGVAEVVARGDGTEGALAAAIDRVLASADLRKAAASHGTRLRTTDPPGTAATLLERLTVPPRMP